MELLKLLGESGMTNFTDVSALLSSDNYKLVIKEDTDFPNLYMVCYDKSSSVMDNPVVRECRGIILEKETNKVVCYTFNKGLELDSDIEQCPVQLDWDTTRVELSIDGTQIRLFYYDGRWNYATTRCIDAGKARWYSHKSYRQLFGDVEHMINYDNLDCRYCYSFVLCHPDNRIVVKYETPRLIHVLTRNMETLAEIGDCDIGVEKPSRFVFSQYGDIIRAILNTDSMDEGYMLCDGKYNRMKIKNVSYCNIKGLRGNTNNLFYRFLQLKADNSIQIFLSFYPEYKDKMALFELDLIKLAKDIHREYMGRFVHKTLTAENVAGHYKKMLYKLHGGYLQSGENTTLDKILAEMNRLHPKQVIYMFNRTFMPHSFFEDYRGENNML